MSRQRDNAAACLARPPHPALHERPAAGAADHPARRLVVVLQILRPGIVNERWIANTVKFAIPLASSPAARP